MSVHRHTKLILLFLVFAFSNLTITLRQIYPAEQLCNDNSLTDTYYPHVKKLDNEYFVIAWYDYTNLEILFQIYDQVGRKSGTNINTGPADGVNRRYIEALPGNKFIIASSSGGSITAKIYDHNGAIVSTFQVNDDQPGFLDDIEIARLDNNRIVILWTQTNMIIMYRVFTSSGSPLTPSTMLQENTTVKCAPIIKAGPGNSFLICWRRIDIPYDYLYCRFYDINGPLGGANITIDTFLTYSRDLIFMSMDRLINGNYVITYNIYVPSNYDTFYAVLSADGNVLVSRTAVNVSNGYTMESPEVTAISTGGFMIGFDGQTCGICDFNIYLQKYDSNNSPVGSNTVIPVDSISTKYDASLAGFNNGGYVIAWDSYNQASGTSVGDIYFNIWYGDEDIICNDISMMVINSINTPLDFGSNVTDDYIDEVKIIFNSLPSSGSVLLTNGNPVMVNVPYPYNLLTYQSDDSSGVYNFMYTAVDYFGNNSPVCNITISKCFSTCQTCTHAGTSTDHQCTTCKIGFFSFGSFCYEICPVTYFPDKSTSTCVKCSSPCDQCTDQSSCTSCSNGYLLIDNQITNNCQSSCPAGYFLSNTTCKQCDYLCAACSGSATVCSSCISTAFYLKEKSQCLTHCPTDYASDELNICTLCKSINKFYSLRKCVASCPSDEYPNPNGSCAPCTNYLYNGICYDSCPQGLINDTVNKTCYLCSDIGQYFYNNSCVQECPAGYYNNNYNCENCPDGKILYNGKCTEECPAGTKLTEGECKDMSLSSIEGKNLNYPQLKFVRLRPALMEELAV
jgi:hypothetical protein